VAGDWRKLQNKELFNVFSYYYYGGQIKYNELDSLCTAHGQYEARTPQFSHETRRDEDRYLKTEE
jgi:hypothetical protein